MHGEGGLLIGVDTKKDPQVLHAAYNDRGGITARFNLNVLDHLNHLLDGDFSTSNFAHVARVSVRQIAAHGNAPRGRNRGARRLLP